MIDYFFVKALYDQAIRDGSPNVIYQAHDKALAAVLDGDGQQIVTATINGKTIGKKPYKTPDQMLKEASLALDYFLNGPQGSFSIDWTLLGV